MYKEALSAMLPYYMSDFANPSEIYCFASKSKKAMNEARKQVAQVINAELTDVYFTSGGTESDNWALIGVAEANQGKGKHIITTAIEHHAILHTCAYLEQRGFDVTYLSVGCDGLIDLQELRNAIRPDTILISIMMANNEIGTIQPIHEIGCIAKDNGIIFHTDAVQAYGHIPIDVVEMNIDLLSASAHKCHGPKGIGLLYIRSGVKINSFHYGGKQEKRLRAGTENIPAIVGFGEASRMINEKQCHNSKYVLTLRNYFIKRVLNEVQYVRLNGNQNARLPGNVSLAFMYVDGEAIQIQLDLKEICCSTGSACNAGSKAVSHVLAAIQIPEEYAYGTVRFTISDDNTIDEIDEVVEVLKEVVQKLRNMSEQYKSRT